MIFRTISERERRLRREGNSAPFWRHKVQVLSPGEQLFLLLWLAFLLGLYALA
jgi:hypothetical protein